MIREVVEAGRPAAYRVTVASMGGAFQYDPQPPMGTGSPGKASPELIEYVRQWVGPLREGLDEFVAKATVPV